MKETLMVGIDTAIVSLQRVGHRHHMCALRCIIGILGLGLMLAGQIVAIAGQSNSLMDISQDGHLLACSNHDSGTLTIVDLRTKQKLHEVRVGAKPEGVSFLGDSHNLAIAVYAEDKVVFCNGDSGKLTGATDVFDEPYGVVSNAAGTKIFVTLEYPGQVIEVDVGSKEVVRTLQAGNFPRGIALSPDERRIVVCEFLTTRVLAIDVESGREVDQWQAASTDNLARQVVFHPSRPKIYLAHIRSRVTSVQGEGAIFPYVGVIDSVGGEGRRRKRIPMDAFQGNLVTANPWEIAVSPDGERLYVVFSGTNDMFVCNVLDDNYREISRLAYLRLGNNPRAVCVAPDNKTFYVYNALDFNVVAYDAASLRPSATIPITENPLGEEILAGKILFYSALQPMVGRRWISCSSCHPDGDADGRTWHNPEGLRNTPPLFGLAWTHPQHWSADRDETQDFEHTIRGKLMQGRGLVRGNINPSLGPPNKGLSKQLDALAAYTNSHKFTLSPYTQSGLSESARRGRQIFNSAETRCSMCHSGPFYCNSTPGPGADVGPNTSRHDVGTGNDDSSEKMGPAYDTPTLLGVYRSAPYLHHGKAPTLTELLTTYNAADKHGKTSHLTETQISDLVNFLNSLPYEDPVPLARAAGMPKVDR